MNPRCWSVFVVALLLLVLESASWAGKTKTHCRFGAQRVLQREIQGCVLVAWRREARSYGVKRVVVSRVHAEQLRCGRLRVGNAGKILREGLSACTDNLENAMMHRFSVSQRVVFFRRWRHLVSVGLADSGFTGGAHGHHYTLHGTYSIQSGKQLSLKQLFPRQAGRLIALARKRLRGKRRHTLYAWKPLSFVVVPQARQKRTQILFILPHSVGVARGTTLTVKVTAKGLPRGARGRRPILLRRPKRSLQPTLQLRKR